MKIKNMEFLPVESLKSIASYLSEPRDYFNLRATSRVLISALEARAHVSIECLYSLLSNNRCPRMVVERLAVHSRDRIDSKAFTALLNVFSDPGNVIRCHRCKGSASIDVYAHSLLEAVACYLRRTPPEIVRRDIDQHLLEFLLFTACELGQIIIVALIVDALGSIDSELFLGCAYRILKCSIEDMSGLIAFEYAQRFETYEREDVQSVLVAAVFSKTQWGPFDEEELQVFTETCPDILYFLDACGIPFDGIPLREMLLSADYYMTPEWLNEMISSHPQWEGEIRHDPRLTMYAVENDIEERLSVLLDHGASIDAVQCLVASKSIEITKLLLKQFNMDINVRHEDRCLLANAVNVEGDEFLSDLLEMGIDVTGLNGYEALVSSLNDFEKMEMLISHGADVNVTFHREGKTLLHMACNGCRYVVSELLEAGTNVNALDRRGNSALMLAVASEKQNLVSLLLSHGADKDVVNSAGHTALSIAKQKGNHTIVSLLCDTKRTLEM